MTLLCLEAELLAVCREYNVNVRELTYGRFFTGRASSDIVVTMARGEYLRRVFGQRAETRHVAAALRVTSRTIRRWKRELLKRGLIPKGSSNQHTRTP